MCAASPALQVWPPTASALGWERKTGAPGAPRSFRTGVGAALSAPTRSRGPDVAGRLPARSRPARTEPRRESGDPRGSMVQSLCREALAFWGLGEVLSFPPHVNLGFGSRLWGLSPPQCRGRKWRSGEDFQTPRPVWIRLGAAGSHPREEKGNKNGWVGPRSEPKQRRRPWTLVDSTFPNTCLSEARVKLCANTGWW